MSGPPLDPSLELDALVGGDLEPEERARLLRVHDLLLEAGPPPELTPDQRTAPTQAPPRANVIALPRRRRAAVLLIAAAFVLAVFGAGWLSGAHRKIEDVERTIAMSGPGGARASLAVLQDDEAGNWPMVMKINGLAALPAGQTYALWLTKHGKLEASCGNFIVGKGTTTVELNAPYHLKEYGGWIIVRSGTTKPLLTTTAT